MKIIDLIKEYDVQTNISEALLNHKIAFIIPPANQYEYKQEKGKHIFINKTGNITSTITINENTNHVIVCSEPEGLRPNFYVVNEDGTLNEDIM